MVHLAAPGVLGNFLEFLNPKNVLSMEVGNANGRLADYPRIVALFEQKPLFGRGVGTFLPEKFFFVDNQYLLSLAEIGLLGVFALLNLYLGSFAKLIGAGRKLPEGDSSMATAAGISVLVFAVASATYDTLGFPQVTALFFIILGIGFAILCNGLESASPQATGSPR